MKRFLVIVFCLVSCGSISVEIGLNDIFSQKDRSYYVLFYLDGCLSCRNSKLKIEELSRRKGFSYYYIDLLSCGFDGMDQDNIGISLSSELNVLYVPTMLFIESGKVVYEFIGYESILKWAYVI